MSTGAGSLSALLILGLAAGVAFSGRSPCKSSSVQCPCGKSGKSITVCLQGNTTRDNACAKWAGCKTCGDGLDGCLECPDDFEGPFCETTGGHCDLIVQGSGRFNCTTGMSGTRCDVFCAGQHMGRYLCYPGQPWEPNLPYCMRPKEVKESRQLPDVVRHRRPCRCRHGGTCDTSGRCVCRADRTGTYCESMVKMTCDDPGFISNGNRKNTDGTDSSIPRTFGEGESVVFGCSSRNYALRGSSILTCRDDGSWSDTRPECIKPTDAVPTVVTCPDPGQVVNADRVNPDGSPSLGEQRFRPGQSLAFTCHPGFSLHRPTLITCLSSGTWSSQLPYCRRIRLTNSTTANPVIQIAYCRDPGVDANSARTPATAPAPRGFPQGSRLQYNCDENYELVGERHIFCLTSGKWSHSVPTCTERHVADVVLVYCSNPGPIKNGKFVYVPSLSNRRHTVPDDPQFPEAARLQYSCDRGYALQGSAVLECGETGEWSSDPPTCRQVPPVNPIVYCRDPGVTSNSVRSPATAPSSRGFPQGSRLKYSCNENYELNGQRQIFCQTSGKWSDPAPTCVGRPSMADDWVYCSNPGPTKNGKFEYVPSISNRRHANPDDPEFPEAARLRYSCDRDYVLHGSAVLECGDTGEWSSNPPTCVSTDASSDAARCDNPIPIPNVRMLLHPFMDSRTRNPPTITLEDPDYPVGTGLEFRCVSGFTLIGSSYVTCGSSGRWSADPPVCRRTRPVDSGTKYCRNPGNIENGQAFHNPSPEERLRPQGGSGGEFPEGSRLQYSCNIGYNLVGEQTLTCKASGQWTATLPKCVRVVPRTNVVKNCKNPGLVDNGQVVHIPASDEFRRPKSESAPANQFPAGSRLEYTCDKEYILQGERTLTCRPSGQWSAPPPTCLAVSGKDILYCDNLGSIPNGKSRYFPPATYRRSASDVDFEDAPELPQGTRIEYSCEDGYNLQGNFELRCEPNGMWSSKAPTCTSDCGRSWVSATRKIIHGSQTLVGEWPWVVAIAPRIGDSSRIQCGGALLNRRTVVTAAHCLIIADSFTLYFGKHSYSNSKDDSHVVAVNTDKKILHPNFNNSTMESDIGLLHFKPPVRFSERIQPICLPAPDTTSKNLMSGRKGYLTGWGLTEKQLPAPNLLMAHVPVLSNDACLESYRNQGLALPITSNMYCAGIENGTQSACSGDSGSAMVFYDRHLDKFTLEGLVSFGVSGQCGLPGRYTVFTRVFNFLPWILRNL